MVVLKKVKSATLIEAVIATVLIVVIFIVASLIMNNLLLNNFSNNTHQVERRLNELEYELINHTISIPYYETFDAWDITIQNTEDQPNNDWITLSAEKEGSKKQVVRKRNYAKE
ncbi:MAG TPA: hypothetical protein VF677_14845 [Flavobacterium sp.]|jgi:predicted Abi (CAAX) family protease